MRSGTSGGNNAPPLTTSKYAFDHAGDRPQADAAARGRHGGAGRAGGRFAPAQGRPRIIPTGVVNVCLVGDGRILIKSRDLAAGSKTKVFRARKFLLTLGNNAVSLHVSGKLLKVPDVSSGIGYQLTTSGNKVLSPAKRPTCA